MYCGILNVYKERGFTSFDVIAKLRGIFRQKKIGHTGTLDPDAEGVLVVCLGKATKLCSVLTDGEKEYETVLLLGQETDTQDISGSVLCRRPVTVSEEELSAVISSFTGTVWQTPPMYSAKKVGGRRLYELAREGHSIEREARPVTISSIKILQIDLPRVRMRIRCSKGTYIRTLCADIGAAAGCGGCMESLIRTRVGDYTLADAKKLARIADFVREHDEAEVQNRLLLPVDLVFSDLPAACAKEEALPLLQNGGRVLASWVRFTDERGADRADPLPGGARTEDAASLPDGASAPDAAVLQDGALIRLYAPDGRFAGVYTCRPSEQVLCPKQLFFT